MMQFKQVITNGVIIYICIGSLFSFPTFVSVVIYFGIAPDSIFEFGIVESRITFLFSVLSAMLRTITWPIGLYFVFDGQIGFWEWLFYHWYQISPEKASMLW